MAFERPIDAVAIVVAPAKGLSLFINGHELRFSEATRGLNPARTVHFFNWDDQETFGRDNSIFTDEAMLDLRIGSEVENVITIAAKTASVELDDDAEFMLTRTRSLANGLLVKLRWTQKDVTSCAWFDVGESTITAKHWVMERASVTFQLEPFSAGERCGSFFHYKHAYELGTTTSCSSQTRCLQAGAGDFAQGARLPPARESVKLVSRPTPRPTKIGGRRTAHHSCGAPTFEARTEGAVGVRDGVGDGVGGRAAGGWDALRWWGS